MFLTYASRIVILLCFICATLFVNAAPVITNAQRLARGLPLAQPKGYVVRRVNGVSRTVPDDKKIAARWAVEPAPSTVPSLTGILEVKGLPGGKSYVGKTFSANGTLGLVTDTKDALIVTFNSPHTWSPTGLRAENPSNTTFPWLSLATGPSGTSGGDLGSSWPSFVILSGAVSQTDALSIPEQVGDSLGKPYLGAETDIWVLSSSTLEVQAKWINPDGKPAKGTMLFYVKTGDYFGLTGNLSKFNADHASSLGKKVTLLFVPAPA